jgi:putative sugar O-methyltransferase
LTRRQHLLLHVFTAMLWTYTVKHDCADLTSRLEEPREGNPFDIRLDGKLVSQDLANSILEYCSIREQFRPPPEAGVTICELGSGYGRNAFVFAHALPHCRYIIVDIPPALYIVQRYLSSVLAGRTVFSFRCFDDITEVASELEQADLIFLLPQQAAMLPDNCVDLFINISSLHEMSINQIDAYFQLIDRLTRGVFYSKQWLISKNPYDHTIIRQSDYPVPRHWREIYSRQARVQRSFFEAMYATE